ncbi:hypothetical protein M409DRAFT_21749 [Zasmidium cellare ATCC 36951]|uniref:Gfo/Idh/MocA-like oxidoreductase N-terminal domain-containing protein n=1 Tax=Zasmidium cellare ATCC 36951 TaxID=1080233 RepID=A0A6A6CR58_ZASCE|nr:uncharacterized protein M409DRAFT_21749 [Zasmidium cellare ATCC 36951]KAF2168312.1 hypothetical protein M409DRAFT_21749 [Zasmidium cellare ATCC 36951]
MAATTPSTPLTVIVIGLGQMGRSHALAYHTSPSYRILALVNRSSPKDLPQELTPYPLLHSFEEALSSHTPDLVSINTHTDTHASYALAALEAGSHVFVEKALAANIPDCEAVIATARRTKKKLIIGYILRHHPSWRTFIHTARTTLGGPPYIFRMNLNQQSTGPAWAIHKSLLRSGASPVVDCGVHYIDAMLQITDSRPVQVRGMGVRLSEEVAEGQVNYGHLQVLFEDGSVGWYEAGWGPMISETAYFVKDVVGPKGAVSIVGEEGGGESADVDGHTKMVRVRIHRVGREGKGEDEVLEMWDEPGHGELCALEQGFVAETIWGDVDLERHWADAVRAQVVVLAADRSMREGRAVDV